MGIKTKFCPMGGRINKSDDKGNLSLWRYSNDIIAGKTLLYNYMGNWTESSTVQVQAYGYDCYLYRWDVLNEVGTETFEGVTYITSLPPTTSQNIYYANGGYNATVTEVWANGAFTTRTSSTVSSYSKYYRNASVDQNINIQGQSTPITLYVPKAGGNAIINDWYDSVSSGTTETKRNTPFYYNPNVVSVDLQDVPFRNNSMYNAFYNCRNLTSVNNIPNSVTSMASTFVDCDNLNQNIQIPDSVTSMTSTFADCDNLNQNIQIPDSVTNMYSTFHNCQSLNQNIQIGNSVTSMVDTFWKCYNLNQNIQIPNSVTDMSATFANCTKLNQNIKIPNSVTTMAYTFYNCTNLNSWINIYSVKVTNAQYCFNVNNADCIPNVFYISRNPVNKRIPTATYNALNAMSWNMSASDGTIIGTSPNRIRAWALGFSNYKGSYNQTHIILNVWHGNMDTFINNNVPVTDVKVPEYLTLNGDPLNYQYPVVLNYPCFNTNAQITSVDLGTEIPWVGNRTGFYTNASSRGATFRNCYNLRSVKGVINSWVTDMCDFVTSCNNLTELDVVIPEGVTKGRALFYGVSNLTYTPPIPSTLANLSAGLEGASSLVTAPVLSVYNANYIRAFNGCSNLKGNMLIITSAGQNYTNMYAGCASSNEKHIYIWYKTFSGVNTGFYNMFKSNNFFKGTSGNGATVDPLYNSTTGFYIHNLSNHYMYTIEPDPVLASNWVLTNYNDVCNFPHMGAFLNYNSTVTPDGKAMSNVKIGNNCYNQSPNLMTLALYDIPWNSTSLSNAFYGCYNLRVIQGLNLTGVTDLSNTFKDCYNLRVMRNIPATVTNMASTFYNCRNFNFNVQILGNSVTSMNYTFADCYNLNQNIKIPNSVTNMAFIFWNCFNLNQNIQIPNSVTSMYGTFWNCCNFNQNIQIPNSVTSMAFTFYICNNLQGRINVLTTELTNSYHTFYTTNASKPKEVYIYFNYANGVPTKTYNLVVANTNANYKWDGQNGVTVYNLGSAPW